MIKIVALDVFGVILASKDRDNVYPPRPGLEAFFDRCEKKEIKIVICSDCPTAGILLREAFERHNMPDLTERIHEFYTMIDVPKYFRVIADEEKVSPGEVLVIGDEAYKDIEGAIIAGCKSILVPEYIMFQEDNFDFSQIEL